MPWSYKEDPTSMIVEVTYTGKTTARDLRESTSALIALEKEKGKNRFLIDTTDMGFAASIMDIYDLPNKQYLEEGADRCGRVAVILPSSAKEKEAVQFYELVCMNRGWYVRAFPERQDAIDWLTVSIPSNKADPCHDL